MGTIEIVIKWLFFFVISAVYYLIGYVLLKGYVSYMKGLDVETLTKQFKIKCAVAVPLVTGAFVLAVWIIREFIKSGVYGENASAALTFTAGLIGLFGALILHTYFITQRRASIDFRTRETIKDLERKIKKLEDENIDLKYALFQAKEANHGEEAG